MFYHFNQDSREDDNFTTSQNIEGEEIRILESNHKNTAEEEIHTMLSFSERYHNLKYNGVGIIRTVFPLKSTLMFLAYICIFIIFLYFGALCFKVIELSKEIEDRLEFKNVRRSFLHHHTCVNDYELEKFIMKVETLTNRGVSPQTNATTITNNWDIPNGVFFVTTLVTTIGYGNDKPVTVGGKLFCIFFVILGVPMMMVLTSAVVQRLFLLVDLLFSGLFYNLGCTVTENRFRRIQVLVCFSLLIVVFLLLPAELFATTEDGSWTYLDSLYYCIISMTTIGLGDYVPGTSKDIFDRDLSKIFATVYLFVGLLWTSFAIRVFHRCRSLHFLADMIYLKPNHAGIRCRSCNNDDESNNASSWHIVGDQHQLIDNSGNHHSYSSEYGRQNERNHCDLECCNDNGNNTQDRIIVKYLDRTSNTPVSTLNNSINNSFKRCRSHSIH